MTDTPTPFIAAPNKRRPGTVALVLLALVAGIAGSVLVHFVWPPEQITTVVHDTIYADGLSKPYSAPSTPAPTTDPDAPTMQPPAPTEVKNNSANPTSNPETTDAPLSPPPSDEPTSTGSENPAPSMESDPASIPPVVATNFVPSATAVPTSFVFCDILWTTPDQQFWLIKTQTESLLISIDDAYGMHFGEAFQANVVMLTSSVGTINEAPRFVGTALPNMAGIC